MKLTAEAAEKAARFVHERTRELAAKYQMMGMEEEFPPWEELPENVRRLAIQVITDLIGNLLIGYVAPPSTPN